jgi:rhodanese-related sulfurtransferase
MIKKARGNLVILDVRNRSEYNLGHLYDAVLIPVYELEERISELQEHVNDPIIVYCKSGLTSLESVEFNSSVTLSQQYAILGKVAKEMGKIMRKVETKLWRSLPKANIPWKRS